MALPKRHRLRGRRAIDHLHRQGRRHHSAHLMLRVARAKEALLPTPDRRAAASPWRCALVISAKVNKRAVVRNRLRRLLHNHLLAYLRSDQFPAASLAGCGPVVAAPSPAGPPAAGDRPAHNAAASQPQASPLEAAAAPAAGIPVRESIAAAAFAPAANVAATAERPSDSRVNGQAETARLSPDTPLWLMVSLRPGSAELEADQLLGECTFVLRRAGLIP